MKKIIPSKNISTALLKHSDIEIINFFTNSAKSQRQFSPMYQNDFNMQKVILNDVINRHIVVKNALINPLDAVNNKIIKDHFEYLYDNNNIFNAQMRGPQIHLSNKMFSDFGFSGNSVNNSDLSADNLSNLISTKNISKVFLPNELMISSPCSFRQGTELSVAKGYSSAMQNIVHLTNDDPNNLPIRPIVYANMPSFQSIADAGVTYYETQRFDKMSITDVKHQSPQVAISAHNFNQPRVVSVVSISSFEETDTVRYLAEQAIKGKMNVSHIDPCANNPADIGIIFNKIKTTGMIEEARDLIGFPSIISNRHFES